MSMNSSSSNSLAFGAWFCRCYPLDELLPFCRILSCCCWENISVFWFIDVSFFLVAGSFTAFLTFSDSLDLFVSFELGSETRGVSAPSACLSKSLMKPLMTLYSWGVTLKLITHWQSKISASFWEQAFFLMQ